MKRLKRCLQSSRLVGLVLMTSVAAIAANERPSLGSEAGHAVVDESIANTTRLARASTPTAAALTLELRLSERRLVVYQDDMLIANYEVAVGREGWSTPTGEFSVFQKQVNPHWEHPFTGVVVPPGPDNPLGSRWIGFWSDGRNSIGFHGTPDESVIGSAVSHGCVRMRNEDIVALYERVTMDTAVRVVP